MKFLELSLEANEASSETGKEASLLLVRREHSGCNYYKENAQLQDVLNGIIQNQDEDKCTKKEEENMSQLEEWLD